MKRTILVLISLLALQVLGSAPSHAHGSFGVSFNVFYDGLSPHGEWIGIGSGVYGWRPVGVAVGWRPYTVGRWCWTDDGWYWMSDEPWGWASYHYGRWTYDDFYGWIWIPGYDWAPAWVEWRYGPDYVGWAPLSPYAVFHVSWGIHYRTRWYTPHTWWNFVGCSNIASSNVHRYVYRNENNTRYIGVTRSGGSVRHQGGRIISRGPEREYIERRGNVRIEPVRIRDVDDKAIERVVRHEGGREQIEVYRPRIEERRNDNAEVDRPSRVRDSGGRQIDLDVRKTDVRAREVDRDEGRDLRRADEYRQRDQIGRNNDSRDKDNNREEYLRDGGPMGGDIQRGRGNEGRTRDRIDQPQPPVRRDEIAGSNDRDRSRSNEGRSRERQPEVRPDGRPERQPQPEPRERRREEASNDRSQREEFRSPNPERTVRRPEYSAPSPERRTESAAPQREAPRSNGSERSNGGRSTRGR